jgi:SAM-dependent methyltransferase
MTAVPRHAPEAAAAALARYYDLDLEDDPGDLDLYVAMAARSEGSILELGAGSGRIAVPLATLGHDVTAVDLDPEMLARAAARWESEKAAEALPRDRGRGSGSAGARHPAKARHRAGAMHLVEADMTSLRLERRFDLVIIALNTLLLLGDAARQLAALRTVAAHLAADGRAVIDIWLPGPDDLALYDGRLLLEWQRLDAETGETVAKLATARYDSASAMVSLTQFFDAWTEPSGRITRTARTDRLRLVPVAELRLLAEAAGLFVELVAGDYLLTPIGPWDERSIMVGRLV